MKQLSRFQNRILAWPWFSPALFGVLILLVYGRGLRLGFVRDDFELIHSLRDISFWDTVPFWRPLWRLWLGLLYESFGFRPVAFHFASLALHGLNACLAFSILTGAGVKRRAALLGVCLWIVMAGNAYAAVWISECNDLLACFFLLLATRIWIALIRCRTKRFSLGVFACLCWLLSMLAKEVGLLWPLAAASALFFVLRHSPANSSQRGLRGFAIGLPLISYGFYFGLKLIAHGASAGMHTLVEPGRGTHLSGSSVPVILIGRLVHYGEGVLYSVLPLDLFPSWGTLLAGVLVFAVLAAFWIREWKQGNRRTGLLFALLGWTLFFSLHASVVPHPRTLYIPTLGTAAIIGILFDAAWERKRSLPGVIGIVFALYFLMHVGLGQRVVHRLSPNYHQNLVRAAESLVENFALKDPPPEIHDRHLYHLKRSYLQQRLRHKDPEQLIRQGFDRDNCWRKFLRSGFTKAFGTERTKGE